MTCHLNYVTCKFIVPYWLQFCILSTCSSSAQILALLMIKACDVTLVVYIWMWLGYLERWPNYGWQIFVTRLGPEQKSYKFCFELMQSSRDLLLKLCMTWLYCKLPLFFFSFFPSRKVGVLNGMMTSLLQSHPLYQRQLIALLVLNRLCSQSTSLHRHLPGLSIRTGHIHPLIPDSPSLLQIWQAFLLRILQIQI